MIEVAFVRQVASVLAPALPYLMGAASGAGQKAAEMAKDKLGEEAWNKAMQIWDKIRPEVEKNPDAGKALKKVADNPDNQLARDALPASLQELLEGMPPQTVNEIRSIVSVSKSEARIVKADGGGVAIGGDVIGAVVKAGLNIYDRKPEEPAIDDINLRILRALPISGQTYTPVFQALGKLRIEEVELGDRLELLAKKGLINAEGLGESYAPGMTLRNGIHNVGLTARGRQFLREQG